MKKTFFILCTTGFSLAGCMQKSTPETFVLAENGDGPATGESFVLRHGPPPNNRTTALYSPEGKRLNPNTTPDGFSSLPASTKPVTTLTT